MAASEIAPPARASAAAWAASKVPNPPSEASGFTKGTWEGAALHQAAQKKRLRLVIVIETDGVKSSLDLLGVAMTANAEVCHVLALSSRID